MLMEMELLRLMSSLMDLKWINWKEILFIKIIKSKISQQDNLYNKINRCSSNKV